MDLHELRRNYDQQTLNPGNLRSDPIQQFREWFEHARATDSASWFEPNAMTMSTADQRGRVSSRILLLKAVSEEGFTFFSNYQSDKARQLVENNQASLLFFWPHVERQVRIEGTVVRTDAQTSDEYFAGRPRGSQIGAVVSRQSAILPSRDKLEADAADLEKQYADKLIPRPDFWGGYLLTPVRVEFWQGRPSRLHDRFLYTRDGDCWQVVRLSP
ncbi:MAG: pyridoxamine 5'-phosphate oxidase [Planctomycetales bacterium]|nr:pyridoxamine 5'-phosphate oxidase [Planctomycetales bacterium]